MHFLTQYKNKLRNKCHNPLSQTIMNQMVIDFQQTKDERLKEEIVNRNMRLAFAVVEKHIRYRDELNPDEVMDYVLQANEGLVSALNRYQHSQIDFALFAFYECLTYLKRFDRHEKDLIKKYVKNGEVQTAFVKYEEPPEVEDVPYKEICPIKLKELLLKILKKERDADIYIQYIMLEKDYGSVTKTSKYFDLTSERVRQIVNEIEKKIRADKNISREILNLMN